jgi:hypothetical protein
MRAIHAVVKGLAPLAAVAALMAVPSLAAASPMYWTEYDTYTPIDTVTVDVTGTIDVDITQGYLTATAACEVTGEVELSNVWNDPTSPATQKIVSLQPADSVANSCTGSFHGYPLSDITYVGPWTGTTIYNPSWGHGYESGLEDVLIQMKWAGGALQAWTAGWLLDPMTPYEVTVGEQYSCVGGFEIDDVDLSGDGSTYPSKLNGTLEFDLDSMQGLAQDDGPCVTLMDY